MFWSETDPDTPKSCTAYCQYLQFFKLKLSQYLQFKKYLKIANK